jgi:hypothetical protein
VIRKEDMAVDEISRIRLARRAVEVFGEAEAETLMDHLPLGGVSNLATKDDLRILGAELRLEISELRGEFGGLRADIEERMNRQTITIISTMTGIMGLMLAVMKWA